MEPTFTLADLAERFRITEEKADALRKRQGWPHLRLGRFDIRFTEDQVEQIDRMLSAGEAAAQLEPALGARVRPIDGQTPRSAARRRS